MEMLTETTLHSLGKTLENLRGIGTSICGFLCAYSPSGNGIVERSRRTVETIAARKNCSILEAVYWHIITPKDDVSPLHSAS